MKISSKTKLKKFAVVHPEAERRLSSWVHLIEKISARNFGELKQAFRKADYVPKFAVFDVGGNSYRIVTVVRYQTQQVVIVDVFTHAQYDKWTKDNRGK
jgi:mRNA interferase HigB